MEHSPMIVELIAKKIKIMTIVNSTLNNLLHAPISKLSHSISSGDDTFSFLMNNFSPFSKYLASGSLTQ